MTSLVHLRAIEVDKLLNMEQCSPLLISPPSTTVIYHKRASSVPLIELRHSDDDDSSSDSEHLSEFDSFAALNNEPDSTSLPSKGGMCSVTDTMESMRGARGVSLMAAPGIRIKHITRNSNGTTRFPKLDECAHFHYENVELGPVKMGLCEEKQDVGKLTGAEKENEGACRWFCVQVVSNGRLWTVRRSYENFRMLDRQLHRCVYDRKYSLLPELPSVEQLQEDTEEYHRRTLTSYLDRFSDLAGSLISCGPVLNWLELDNRGNRLIVPDESAINTPAVAAAYVVRRYTAQATDEISFEVGDMISVIDMPPPEESTWWRGKKGFEVGFFPCECVEVIGDKIPHTLKVPKSPTKPVLRKHGKLIAFFRSFLLTRPSRRKLKQSGILKERVFGCDLGEHLLNTGREIPLVLKCCAEFIEEHGIVDGIYRLSGVNSNIQKLRLAFDEDRVPDLTDEAIVQDIHCVASLLKMYFRELPNPLLTYQLYDKFVNAVQSEEEVRLLRLRDIVQQLPPPHYRTLEYLMLHLAKVAGHGGRTGMTPKNVAIVWAPNLLRSKDVEGGGVGALHVVGVQAVLTEYLIRYADLLFNEKLPAFQSINLDESSPRRARPKSLAISTPTKLLSLEEARSRALSANLPPAQQKYIDVGGGPDNLPPKYHTVIDFPGGKRGSGKIKKSPSGWKSFFSRGWHSGSTREKERVRTQRKVSSGSLQHTSLTMQDVAITELDVTHSKKLRTVKSAESLVLLGGGGSSSRNSGASEFSICAGNKTPCRQTSMDYAESDDDDEPQESSYLPLTPQHMKHNRSSSHESYFEQEMDIPLEENDMEEDNSIFNLVSETMSRMKEQSTNKAQCMEMNSDYFGYQTLCASESDTLPLSDVSDSGQDDLSHIPSDSSSGTQKSIRKQKLKDGESEVASAKVQKLSMMRFQQSAGSSLEKSENDLISSSDDDSSSTEIYKWKDPECIADCSTDSMPSQNLSPPVLLEGTSCFIDSKDVITLFDSDTQEKNMNNESALVETLQDESEDSRVVVERYGNEETVIVEVHATQESSDDETEKLHFESSSNLGKSDTSKSQITSVCVDCNETSGISSCSRFDVNDRIELKDIEILFVDEHGKTVDDTVDVNRNIGLINKNSNTVDSEITHSPVRETNYKSEQSSLSTNDMINQSSEKVEMVEVTKNDESPTNIPSLRPGSFASEVMEEYLLIKKSLDQAHFLESDEQCENSKDACLTDDRFDATVKTDEVSVALSGVKESPTATLLSLNDQHNSTNKDFTKSNLREKRSEKASNIIEEDKKETTKETKISENEVSAMETKLSSKELENLSEECHQTSFDGVQLRHAPSKVINNCQSEKKRNSEPEHLVIGSKHTSNPTERKRMSEPASSLSGEKNTVKGLMLKFEPVVSRENEICAERRSSTSSKPKISHPSLFTQLKVLKLQSLQSGTSVTTPTEVVDPWSDPILDLEEEKELQSPVVSDRPSLIIHRDTAKISEEKDSAVVSSESSAEIKSSKDNIAQETDIPLRMKEEKCALEINASLPDLMDTSNCKGSEEISELEVVMPVSCSVEDSSASSSAAPPPEDEVIRRERINRIKEERRAQLREKLKSESFRMEAEEKEKVLNEFRLRKHSSGTKATTTESSDDHVKNVLPRSQREKNNESESTQRQCSRIKKENALDHTTPKTEIPKHRTNISVQKELPQKNLPERYLHKQQPTKQCLHRSVSSDNPHSVQEKNQSKIENPTKPSERLLYKSSAKERLKKAASLDNPKQQSSTCETGHLSPSSKVGKKAGEKPDKVPLSPNKSQIPSQDSKRVFSPSQRSTNTSQKRIRERAAMFEHPKDSSEACRTGTPSSRFARQRSSPSLTPSYVR